jgi:zinc-binding in reverse transcriptase
MYLFLNFRGVNISMVGYVWNLKIPLNIKKFIWLALQEIILTKDVLLCRGWLGSASCVFCTSLESFDHIFFYIVNLVYILA